MDLVVVVLVVVDLRVDDDVDFGDRRGQPRSSSAGLVGSRRASGPSSSTRAPGSSTAEVATSTRASDWERRQLTARAWWRCYWSAIINALASELSTVAS
jgi:hypothetical protein